MFSIKLFLEKVESEIRLIIADPGKTQSDKIAEVLSRTIMVGVTTSASYRHPGLPQPYTRGGRRSNERVRRRTIRMRHILAGVLIEGQKRAISRSSR